MGRRSKKRKKKGYSITGRATPGYTMLQNCLAEHAPPGYRCLINSEWCEQETVRMAMCCGYDEFMIVDGHYDLIDGQAWYDDIGCMLFVPAKTLKEMVEYS